MPLYEYECESCNHRFEKIVKYSDPPLDTCPKCGKGPVRKLFSSPAIQFKGSGWYITDYAKKSTDSGQTGGGNNSSEKSDKTESSSKSDKSESKSDKGESGSKSDKGESTSKPDASTSTSSTKSTKAE
jgi:putative FmdB family regulatory protein